MPMWIKLQQDIVQWNLSEVDTIKSIKQKALAGNLRRRKAQTVTAFVETIDRSATDPLIVLRDTTGTKHYFLTEPNRSSNYLYRWTMKSS